MWKPQKSGSTKSSALSKCYILGCFLTLTQLDPRADSQMFL